MGRGNKIAAMVNRIILMGLSMPGIDGLGINSPDSAQILRYSVIALTAFSTDGFRRAAHQTGFDGYLTKPVDFSRLHDLIGRLIGLSRSSRTRSRSS